MNRKIISILLCMALFVSNLSVISFANILDVEIDIGGLFDDEPINPAPEDDNKVPDDAGNKEPDKEPNKKPGTSIGSKDDDEKENEKKEEKPVVYNSVFTDVLKNHWFYADVTDLASKGIIAGYEEKDGSFTFRPTGAITRAEFIKLVVEAMDFELTAYPTFSDVTDNKWYYTYVSAAVKNGLIEVGTEDYGDVFGADKAITRKEVAKILVKAAKLETGKYKSPYADTEDENVVALYAACLMQGSITNDSRFFYADTGIVRSETAAVIARLIKYNADKEGYVKSFMEEFKVPAPELIANANYIENTMDIGENPMSVFSWHTSSSPSHNDFEIGMTDAFSGLFAAFPEIFTFTWIVISKSECTDGVDVSARLVSKSDTFGMEELHEMKCEAINQAQSIASFLFNGKELSDSEKVKKIYSYLIENLEYPEKAEDIHYTAYGAFTEKKAVCQGYASAFNLLCRAAGIKCVGVSGGNHAWNAIKTEEGILFCDAATEDSSKKFSNGVESKDEFNLCLVSYEEMEKLHGNFSVPLEIYFDME